MELLVLRMLSRDSADSRDEALCVRVVELSRPASISPSASSLRRCMAGSRMLKGFRCMVCVSAVRVM